jgi:uncharacterized protein YkwD
MSTTLRRGDPGAARSALARGSRRSRPELESLERRQMLSTTSAFEPSADEQYMLQLVNRARANPAAEGQRLLAIAKSDPTIEAALAGWDASAFLQQMNAHGPLPPLAFNVRLGEAARAHDLAMVAANAQVHTEPGTLARPTAPDQLAPDGQPYYPTGDSSWTTAENVFAYSDNLADPHGKTLDDFFHDAFLLDWGNPDFGHLRNLMLPGPSAATAAGGYAISEIGIGIVTDVHPTAPPTANPEIAANAGINVGPALVTEEFGWRSGHEFLTGAIYADRAGDGFYLPGEGLAGVTVSAVGLHGEGTYSAQTWGSGGYSLDLPAGSYAVTASGGGLASTRTTTITIGTDNVGWDIAVPSAAPPATTPPAVPAAGSTVSGPGRTLAMVAPPSSGTTTVQATHHARAVHHQSHPKPTKWHRHR